MYNLKPTQWDLRDILVNSELINMCIDSEEAYEILQSDTEYDNDDHIFLFFFLNSWKEHMCTLYWHEQ